jgi:hypothetical protein
MEDKAANLDAVLKEAVDLVRSSSPQNPLTNLSLFDSRLRFPSRGYLFRGCDSDRLAALCSVHPCCVALRIWWTFFGECFVQGRGVCWVAAWWWTSSTLPPLVFSLDLGGIPRSLPRGGRDSLPVAQLADPARRLLDLRRRRPRAASHCCYARVLSFFFLFIYVPPFFPFLFMFHLFQSARSPSFFRPIRAFPVAPEQRLFFSLRVRPPKSWMILFLVRADLCAVVLMRRCSCDRAGEHTDRGGVREPPMQPAGPHHRAGGAAPHPLRAQQAGGEAGEGIRGLWLMSFLFLLLGLADSVM